MLNRLNDWYDDATTYIYHNEKNLANDNISAVSMTSMFLSGLLLFIIVIMNVLFSDIHFRIPELYPIVASFVFDRLTKRYRDKVTASFRTARIYSMIFYAVEITLFSYLDLLLFPDGRGIAFPLGMFIISTIYMDYVFIFAGYKAALLGGYAALLFSMKDVTHIWENILIAILSILISTFCSVVLLGVNASRGLSSRNYEIKSQTDLLTGLYNKLAFEEKSRTFLQEKELGQHTSLFILDFDYFKKVNDNYGHQTGDDVLKAFGKILKSVFRGSDIIGRVGGDEFMVLVTGHLPEGYVEKRCEIILHELKVLHCGEAGGFSCSIGVCENNSGSDFDDMYRIADEALFEVKEAGRAGFRSR